MSLDTPMTKTDFAAQRLRERIFSGELAPGDRLMVEHLKADLGMSPTPIREALRVLQAEGLIVHRPHHGMVVARQSIEDVQEICDLRAVLEPHALELAMPNMDAATLDKLDKLHAELVSAGEHDNATEAIAINHEWHWLIYRTAGSARLSDYIQRLWNAFPWRVLGTFPGRAEHAIHEHEPIQDAIRNGDTKAAGEALREHIKGGQQALVQRLREIERDQTRDIA